MKRFIICFLFAIPLAQSLMAELPDLTGEELVDLIQLQENRIQYFQVKYRLTGGEYSEKGDLVPDVSIDCEYAHDIGKGHRYLHEKWVKEDLERKYAYDGKTGMDLSLKLPGDPGRMYGTIMPKASEVFSDQAIWKPDWSEYGFIKESDTLSSTIRNARKVEVTTEESDGEELYRVTFVATGEKEKFVDPAGRTSWFDTGGTYVAWLSPHKSFRPVKIAELRGPGGDVISFCSASDFREISPGVWLPYRLERYSVRRRRGRVIEVNTIEINEKASVVFRLEFPLGTYVEDEVAGIEYRVGLSDDFLDTTIEETVDKVHLAREGGEVDLPDYNQRQKQANDDNVPVVKEGEALSQNVSPEESDVKDSSEGHSKGIMMYLIPGFFVVLGFLFFAYYMHRR